MEKGKKVRARGNICLANRAIASGIMCFQYLTGNPVSRRATHHPSNLRSAEHCFACSSHFELLVPSIFDQIRHNSAKSGYKKIKILIVSQAASIASQPFVSIRVHSWLTTSKYKKLPNKPIFKFSTSLPLSSLRRFWLGLPQKTNPFLYDPGLGRAPEHSNDSIQIVLALDFEKEDEERNFPISLHP